MPEKKTLEAAQEDKREGKAPTTQAGEFVREEIHHVREGKHGARNPKQAIAIGLSKARRAGVHLPPPGKGQSAETRKKAVRDVAKGAKGKSAKPSPKRSRARVAVLKREGRGAASRSALSKQTKTAAKKRGSAARSATARKAVKTKGPMARKAAARKAARTRARRSR